MKSLFLLSIMVLSFTSNIFASNCSVKNQEVSLDSDFMAIADQFTEVKTGDCRLKVDHLSEIVRRHGELSMSQSLYDSKSTYLKELELSKQNIKTNFTKVEKACLAEGTTSNLFVNAELGLALYNSCKDSIQNLINKGIAIGKLNSIKYGEDGFGEAHAKASIEVVSSVTIKEHTINTCLNAGLILPK